MFLDRFLQGVTGFTFALDVLWEILNTGPTFVRATFGAAFDHHVVALLVVIRVPIAIGVSWCVGGDAVEGSVAADRVYDLLLRSRFQCFGVGVCQRCDGTDGAVVTSE